MSDVSEKVRELREAIASARTRLGLELEELGHRRGHIPVAFVIGASIGSLLVLIARRTRS